MFDYLLQFYWPTGQVSSKRKTRRHTRRVLLSGVLPQKRIILQLIVIVGPFVVLAFSGAAVAREKLTDRRNIIFDHLGAEEGIQATVTNIVQDSEGFIWVGTQEGLYRYDGYSFRPSIMSTTIPIRCRTTPSGAFARMPVGCG